MYKLKEFGAVLDNVQTEITFMAESCDLRDAGVKLRESISEFGTLNRSLLAAHPACAEALGIDGRAHTDVRKFRDEQGLNDYISYLQMLVERAARLTPEYVPKFDCGQGSFTYTTVSGRGTVTLFRSGEGWYMGGRVTLPSRMLACKIRERLLNKGVDARVN